MIYKIDNFLKYSDWKNINANLLGTRFSWYYNSHKVKNNDGQFQFTHLFWSREEGKNSDYYELVNPIIDKLNPDVIARVKANLTTKTENIKDSVMHNDLNNYSENQWTGIYYVNTNNGVTKFETGDVCESVANRFVCFKSDLKHAGTTHTDENVRCVINFNWFGFIDTDNKVNIISKLYED